MAKRRVPRISDAEWEVMRVVWDRHPVDAGAVAEELCARRDWSDRTVKSLLSRLVRKGALGFDLDGKRYLYRPLVKREACVRESDLSAEEIAELRRLLEEKGGAS
jgi:BlaI family penicillinase repressor